MGAWEVFRRSTGQIRFAMTAVAGAERTRVLRVAYGLDFGAMIQLADRMGAANNLFIDLLPEIEAVVVRAYNREAET